MACVLLPRGIWTEVLAVTLLVLNSQVAAGRHAPEHFTEQLKFDCHFENGTERVRFVERYIHNREEYVRFDSDVGEYVAVTELGRPTAERWNSQKEILEDERAAVDTFCRHNYELSEPFLVSRSEAQSESAQSKMLSGVRGLMLGLIFFGVGLFVYKRSQKGNQGSQPTGLLS